MLRVRDDYLNWYKNIKIKTYLKYRKRFTFSN